MPIYTLHVYECDNEGCSTTVIANTLAGARSEAAAQGWSVSDSDNVKCREHRTYEKCAECERDMRPWGTPKALHPTTISAGSKGLCATCTARKGRGKPNSVKAQDEKMTAAVDRYVSMSGEAFKQLFLGDPNERAALARKVAPQDLWETLGI